MNCPHSDTYKDCYPPPGLINSLFGNKYNDNTRFNTECKYCNESDCECRCGKCGSSHRESECDYKSDDHEYTDSPDHESIDNPQVTNACDCGYCGEPELKPSYFLSKLGLSHEFYLR